MAVEKDIVLIYFEEEPLCFARIEQILPNHKPDWYHVKLLLLQLPLQVVTWILKDLYIEGTEFTMGGKKMRLEPVESPTEEQVPTSEKDNLETTPPTAPKSSPGKVISFDNRREK